VEDLQSRRGIVLPGGAHRRRDLLTGDWVLVSPHRTARPWQGQQEVASAPTSLPHDPTCYLCPGNPRAGGQLTPEYSDTFVFDNDFPALLPTGTGSEVSKGLLQARPERGICRVVCYSPRHDLSLGQLTAREVTSVVDTWADQYEQLGAVDWVRHVQIFENRGAMMGASNPHPHGQIWAQESVPGIVARELAMQGAHADGGRCLLCDYLAAEIAVAERVVFADAHHVVLVPFWATWPFETLLLPRRHCGALPEQSGQERASLAEALSALARCYDSLFGVAFPYSMGLHQKPTDGRPHDEWHLHTHFYPPLLRSATVRKFMVGYELMGEPQRDITPEVAAESLRRAWSV
jgi:UDPglucose--hexose-1-phosphate uridylyltransferase